MSRFLPVLAVFLYACGGAPPKAKFPEPLPPPPPVAVVEQQADPNFELVVVEAVPNAEDEGVSFTKAFLDGKEVGKTVVGPRSQEKRLRLRLPIGNGLMRFEQWFLPPVGEWTLLPEARQPRERFVRVDEGRLARVTIRYDVDGVPSLRVSHEAAAPKTAP